jgi:UDP-glucose 4-epimerase
MGAPLADQGAQVTTLDNLCGGHRDAVLHGRFIEGDLADLSLLSQVLAHGQFDAVMHFASFIQVGESVRHPAQYYRNNVVNTLNLLECMVEAGVKRFILSSTAAIFGEPASRPLTWCTRAGPSAPTAAAS